MAARSVLTMLVAACIEKASVCWVMIFLSSSASVALRLCILASSLTMFAYI